MDCEPSALRHLIERQRSWALLRELDVGDDGLTGSTDANLYRPLHPETRAELIRRPERPLGSDGDGGPGEKPAPIRRLHSREALLCNIFDPWRERDASALFAACDAAEGAEQMSFADPDDPADAAGAPIDVFLEGRGRPTALVTTYTEAYESPARNRDARFLASAEREDGPLRELPGCRGLALDRRANPGRFQWLPVVALLEHAARLTHRHGHRGFRLVHLWFEAPGAHGRRLQAEIDRFRMRAGGEVDFCAASFQEVFGRLASSGEGEQGEPGWARYVSDRYFST